MGLTAETELRRFATACKLLVWANKSGLHVGRVQDVPLLTIVADEHFGYYKIIRRGSTAAGYDLSQCKEEIEALVRRR